MNARVKAKPNIVGFTVFHRELSPIPVLAMYNAALSGRWPLFIKTLVKRLSVFSVIIIAEAESQLNKKVSKLKCLISYRNLELLGFWL